MVKGSLMRLGAPAGLGRSIEVISLVTLTLCVIVALVELKTHLSLCEFYTLLKQYSCACKPPESDEHHCRIPNQRNSSQSIKDYSMILKSNSSCAQTVIYSCVYPEHEQDTQWDEQVSHEFSLRNREFLEGMVQS